MCYFLHAMQNTNTPLIWDTHRSLNPWLLLFKPATVSSIVQSLLTIARDGGDLPKWPLANVCAAAPVHGRPDSLEPAFAGTLVA
jgi:putative alpha-1,2-mannosidase